MQNSIRSCVFPEGSIFSSTAGTRGTGNSMYFIMYFIPLPRYNTTPYMLLLRPIAGDRTHRRIELEDGAVANRTLVRGFQVCCSALITPHFGEEE